MICAGSAFLILERMGHEIYHCQHGRRIGATTDVPDTYAGLGSRALTSPMISREVPADYDPLGPENKLIFAPGYLSGTPLINSI